MDSPNGQAVAGVSDLGSCKMACVGVPDYRCEAVLWNGEQCFRKRHIDIPRCTIDPSFDLYLRPDSRPASAAVPIIIDTDMSFDVDDVGAVCMAHALHDLGEARLLAIGHSSGYPQGIGAASVLAHFYGHDDIPLGAYKGPFGLHVNRSEGWVTGDYVPSLVKDWPSPVKHSDEVPDAVEVYRRALAAADDHSVVIVAIGFATNLAALLRSAVDDIVPLSGHDLVARKVRVGAAAS